MSEDTLKPSLDKPSPRSSGGLPTGGAGPFSRLEWMLAGRYLRAKRAEGGISVIAWFSFVGITLSVGTLIVVMAVMVGFRVEFVKRVLGSQGHVTLLASEGPGLSDYDTLAQRLGDHPQVLTAAPLIEGQVLASSDRANAGVLVKGLRLEDLRRIDGVARPESQLGSLDDFGDGVALGQGLARKLGLTIGGEITLINPKGMTTVFGPKPTIKRYKVTYIFRVGMHAVDSILVYMPLVEAQKFFRKPGLVDAVDMMVADPDALDRDGLDPLSTELYRLAGPDTYLWNWKGANTAFLNALDVERVMMFIILSLLVLIAALNIISGLVMLVKNKGRDIGILRTIGLPRGGVLRVFFLVGALIGTAGTVLGVVLGMLFADNIQHILTAVTWAVGMNPWDPSVRQLTTIPAEIRFGDVAATVTLSLSLSYLVTLIPAWQAARLDPVEALRYE